MDFPWPVAVGILGNAISFLVYLAPLPTFYRVYKKKSTEGFQSVPYVVALFSAMLWIYYAFVKTGDATLLISINAIGCFIETAYVIMFLIYAPRNVKILTLRLVSLLNVVVYGFILLLTLLLSKGSQRAAIMGWICVACSVCVFVAPLSVIRLVIKTRSVEFMPFSLSCTLTVSAVIWFLYGLLSNDLYVALPNILGFAFGVAQMILYLIYKNAKKIKQESGPEHVIAMPKIIGVVPIDSTSDDGEDEKMRDQTNGNDKKESKGAQEKVSQQTNGKGKKSMGAKEKVAKRTNIEGSKESMDAKEEKELSQCKV